MSNSALYRIKIDQDRCQGHNRCCSIAPDFFEPDDYGNVLLKGDGTILSANESSVRLAIVNCPERALSLVNVSQ